MYIGLYDQDLILSGTKVYPSLEIMLLSAYYKKQGIVEVIGSLEEINKFDKVYVNRNRKSIATLPPQLFTNPKIEWFGSGVTGNFVPIEKKFYQVSPDKTVYQNFYQTFLADYSTRKKTIIGKMLSNDFTLLKITEGNELLIDLENLNYRNRKILLFDTNLFENPYCLEIIEKLKDNQVYFLNRQRTDNFEAFKKCQDYGFKPADRNRTAVGYEGKISKDQFLSIWNTLGTAYCLGIERKKEQCSTEYFVEQQLIQKGNFMFYGRAHNKLIPILDNLDEDKGLPCRTVLNRFCTFSQQTSMSTDTNFLTYMNKCSIIVKEEMKRMMKNPQVYTLFMTNLSKIKGKGVWQL